MSEIQYIERVPRRWDFCGCPPCPMCYEPVIVDGQKAPAFEEVMSQIYGEGPKPQTPQEYEWAHAAAHRCRQEFKVQPDGDFFEAEDRARVTQMQIDDLLKRAKKKSEAPKPLNTVNLDDMPMEAVMEAVTAGKPSQPEEVVANEVPEYAPERALARNVARAMDQQAQRRMNALLGVERPDPRPVPLPQTVDDRLVWNALYTVPPGNTRNRW